MTFGTDDFSPPFGSALDLTPIFDAGLIFGAVIVPAPGTVASCVASMVINPHITFYYGKTVMAKDLTS